MKTYEEVENAVRESLGLEDNIEIDEDLPLGKLVENINPLEDIVPIFHKLGVSLPVLRTYAGEESLTAQGVVKFLEIAENNDLSPIYQNYFKTMANLKIERIAATLSSKAIHYLITK